MLIEGTLYINNIILLSCKLIDNMTEVKSLYQYIDHSANNTCHIPDAILSFFFIMLGHARNLQIACVDVICSIKMAKHDRASFAYSVIT